MKKVVPLVHKEDTSIADRMGEAVQHFNEYTQLQVVAWLIDALRKARTTWWTGKILRLEFSAQERMKALDARPDLRQKITTAIVGTGEKMAYAQSAERQASDIDVAIAAGDRTEDDFEEVSSASEIVSYMGADKRWRLFRKLLPLKEDREVHQELIAGLINVILQHHILSAQNVRKVIDPLVWPKCIPPEVRADIHEALLASQAEGDLFLPENILMIATPEVIAKSIKLVDLMGILDLAEKEMGFNAEEDEGLIDPAAEAGGPDAEASEGSLEGSLDRLDDVGGDDGPKA